MTRTSDYIPQYKRTLVIGDIHGSYESLRGVLSIANYNPLDDRLITLGDYIDGWDQSYEVVHYLIACQNESPHSNIYLMGNHDKYLIDVLNDGFVKFRDVGYTHDINAEWWQQGGETTYRSYISHSDDEILRHKTLFYNNLKYYHEEDNRLFVHAGYNHKLGLKATLRINKEELLWNRSLYQFAMNQKNKDYRYGDYDQIFIGHTPSNIYGITEPEVKANVINLDQGCKTTKRLTCWELGSGQWWQYGISYDLKN